jgi:eukaryotic-like serine/threonine-protein kinase
VLEGTMTRDPEHRWSMARVRDALVAGPAGTLVQPAPASTVPMQDPEGTELLPAAVPPVEPEPAHRRRPTGPLVAAAAIVLLVGVIVWAALASRAPEQETPSAGGPTSETTSAPSSPKPSNPKPTRSPSIGPTVQGMEQFIGDYLSTAAADPASGYTMLTPGFQQQSGGIEGYRSFWDTVDRAELQSIEADPASLSVNYTVAYQTDSSGSGSGASTDDVSLTLEFQDGTYKIAAES